MAVIAAYGNSFHGPFIFDDKPSIVENPSIRHLWSGQVLTAPQEAMTVVGRPVLNLSLAINYALGGLNVEGYHAVNLAIHILAALALFGLVRRTLLLPALAARFGPASTGLALAVALVWALHPLQTESVTYIVQRAEALVGLFYLLTLYCFVRGVTSARSNVWYAAAVGACALGMASKEVMVTAPLVALLYDRLFISGSFKEGLRRRWRWYLALAATWVILGLLVYLSLGRGGSAGFGLGMSVWEYARTQFGCIMHYLRLTFWPSPLVLDYGTGTVSRAADIVPYAIGVGVLLAATAAALALRPRWGFLGVWFFAILAPTSSIVPLVGQTEAEHRMYLPLAAVVTLVVLVAYAALERLGRRAAQVGAGALVLAVAAALGWGTYQRNEVYQSDLGIWNDTVEKCPLNSRACNNCGIAYEAKGEYDRAIQDLDRAIQLKANYAEAYNNRGIAYEAKGEYDRAVQNYDQAIRLNPDDAEVQYNLATLYGKRGRLDQAIQHLTEAVRLRPDWAEAYCSRGFAFLRKREYSRAIQDYDQAIRLQPNSVEAYANRANAYAYEREYDRAIEDYDRAIQIKPDDAMIYGNRGTVYYSKKEYDKAWADVKMCRKLGGTPNPEFIEDLTRASGRSE